MAEPVGWGGAGRAWDVPALSAVPEGAPGPAAWRAAWAPPVTLGDVLGGLARGDVEPALRGVAPGVDEVVGRGAGPGLAEAMSRWEPALVRLVTGATPVTAGAGELLAQRAGGEPLDWDAAAGATGLAAIPLGAVLGTVGRPVVRGAGRVTRKVAEAATAAWLKGTATRAEGRLAADLAEQAYARAIEKVPAVALGRFRSTTPGRILRETQPPPVGGGGYSVQLTTGEVLRPKAKGGRGGLAVGIYRNADPRTTVIAPGVKATPAMVRGHVGKNAKALQPLDRFFGTWFDPDDGTIYFDVAQWFPGDAKRKAIAFGARTKQISGYDVETGKTFRIGDWTEFIQSDDFQQRMAQMARRGRQYLAKHGDAEWWDIHGSAFERVYGRENLEVVAGLIAATAPRNTPRQNLKIMTEYMRRVLKGEPVIQKDWRKPADIMAGKPGTKLWGEGKHRINVVKAARGEWWNLQKEKVREEAAALLGDPNAFVGDRHWARLAESPMEGVVIGPAEGVIPSSKHYALLKEAVMRGAKAAGRSVRDFSADVWTGVRETIKRDNALFGAPYAGSAVSGESMGYAGHFEQLLAEKAAHLSRLEQRTVTVPELEGRLRRGEANLLSWLLATPVGAAIYVHGRALGLVPGGGPGAGGAPARQPDA